MGSELLLAVIGVVNPFEGRLYMLLDPSSRNKIPIIASVSEHQATAWASFFFDCHFLLFFMPAGLYYCYRDLTDASLFLIVYGLTITYFAGIMVRIVLVFAPAAACLSAVAISETLWNFFRACGGASQESKDGQPGGFLDRCINWAVTACVSTVFALLFFYYVVHCTWVTAEAYSSPSIVLMSRGHNGQKIIFDDFREAYRWLDHNTAPEARIMSWWDYGYQMTAMGRKVTLVDNNTWNNTHIATVGRCMSSSEPEANKVMRRLDVDYVLAIFGGMIGYSSDDINKFLWMVKISSGVYPKHVQERNYYSEDGQYRVDGAMSKTMQNCLMYKMCYYRFAEATNYGGGQPSGFDRVRNVEIGHKNVRLSHLDEAFTSEHWLVRIYKVKPDPNRGPALGGP
eukprot:NODE_470_length_1449_cov_141.001429_g351_i0.p1 GENE.NODE_470_length_1449_cov_141.001429_g351_i0~~NODE_470_length_1449_cov_141.001429_g351_i0.p1  ORF type:complete len:414 (-),score=171.58 NODE_470_length_1449_cov_141.001429_g351_i0:206-1399(-)